MMNWLFEKETLLYYWPSRIPKVRFRLYFNSFIKKILGWFEAKLVTTGEEGLAPIEYFEEDSLDENKSENILEKSLAENLDIAEYNRVQNMMAFRVPETESETEIEIVPVRKRYQRCCILWQNISRIFINDWYLHAKIFLLDPSTNYDRITYNFSSLCR